jgi:hypothetical protein
MILFLGVIASGAIGFVGGYYWGTSSLFYTVPMCFALGRLVIWLEDQCE